MKVRSPSSIGSNMWHMTAFLCCLLLTSECLLTSPDIDNTNTSNNKLPNGQQMEKHEDILTQYRQPDARRADDQHLDYMQTNNNDTFKFCHGCHCYNDRNSYTVDCSRKKLTSIQGPFPRNVTSLILAYNAITNVTGGNFENLTCLKVLDLSFNKIEMLCRDVFIGVSNLTSLNLNGNRLFYGKASMPEGVFGNLPHLKELKIQQNLSIVHMDEAYPILVNSLKYLYLDGLNHNALGHNFKSPGNLKWLIFNGTISRCKIYQVTVNMFENVITIERLALRQCKLKSVEKGSFRELACLKSLDLSHNELLTFAALSNITYGLQFVHSFERLNLNKIHKTYGECTKLQTKDLLYLYNTTVQYVYLETNRLSTLETDAVNFIPPSLQVLSLKDNQLILDTYVLQLFVNILLRQESTFAEIRMLVISDQGNSHDLGDLFKDLFPIPYRHVDLPKQHQLQRQTRSTETDESSVVNSIDASKTTHSKIDDHQNPLSKFVSTALFPNNTDNILNLAENLANDAYNGFNFSSLLSVFNAHVDILHQCQVKTPLPCAPLPKDLVYVDMSNYKVSTDIRSFCVCEPNNLKTLLASKNLFFKWNGPIYGLSNLTSLDLSYNWCFEMNPKLFYTFPSLKTLNLSQNFLSFSLNIDYSGEIFGHLSKLELLNLADNKIHQLPKAVFKGLTSLRELDLHDNQIDVVNWDMSRMKNLERIDLSQNFILKISPTVRGTWNLIAVKHNMSVCLKDNKLKCSCKYLDIVQWMAETPAKLDQIESMTCKMDNSSVSNLTNAVNIYKQLSRACATYTSLIVGTSLAIAVSVIVLISTIVHRYRWDLRYMYYSAKFRLKGYNSVSDGDQQFDYDVFISYAHEDSNFVKQSLVPELEGKQSFHLQVHDRDFRAGNFVADNIMQAVTTSKKTLVIMSLSFLRSTWCMYELNMARMEGIKTGRDVLCVLMKEDIPTHGLPLETLDIICQQTYLEYPNDAPEMLDQFWTRLGEALKA